MKRFAVVIAAVAVTALGVTRADAVTDPGPTGTEGLAVVLGAVKGKPDQCTVKISLTSARPYAYYAVDADRPARGTVRIVANRRGGSSTSITMSKATIQASLGRFYLGYVGYDPYGPTQDLHTVNVKVTNRCYS